MYCYNVLLMQYCFSLCYNLLKDDGKNNRHRLLILTCGSTFHNGFAYILSINREKKCVQKRFSIGWSWKTYKNVQIHQMVSFLFAVTMELCSKTIRVATIYVTAMNYCHNIFSDVSRNYKHLPTCASRF